MNYKNPNSVLVVIYAESTNRVLMLQRKDDSEFWQSVTGTLEEGETSWQAAVREVKEEMGLIIKPEQLRFITTYPNNYLYKNVPYRTMDIFFECELKAEEVHIVAPDEIKELRWIALKDIREEEIGFISVRTVIKQLQS